MNLLQFTDPFQIARGNAPISIGAPHHGSRPGVKADWGTGPIALALGQHLDGQVVVVKDLRSKVDVNKDPLHLDRRLRHYAVRYQDLLFASRPGFVIEIHGHTSGKYDIELSTGFELDPSSAADAEYIEKLKQLRSCLSAILPGRLGKQPTIGVWPLDRDVVKTATDTFTFQKLRRARHLSGMNWYGLHIELSSALRIIRQPHSGRVQQLPDQVVHILAGALAESIRQAFDPLPSPSSSIPLHSDSNHDRVIIAKQRYKVGRVQQDNTAENRIILHPDALNSFGALEGDSVIIQGEDEELSSQVATSQLVQRNEALMNARMRNQVSVKPGQTITLMRQARALPDPADPPAGRDQQPYMVVHCIRTDGKACIWLSPADMQLLGFNPRVLTSLVGRVGLPTQQVASLEEDGNLPLHGAVLSEDLSSRLGITLGETLHLEQVHHG